MLVLFSCSSHLLKYLQRIFSEFKLRSFILVELFVFDKIFLESLILNWISILSFYPHLKKESRLLLLIWKKTLFWDSLLYLSPRRADLTYSVVTKTRGPSPPYLFAISTIWCFKKFSIIDYLLNLHIINKTLNTNATNWYYYIFSIKLINIYISHLSIKFQY